MAKFCKYCGTPLQEGQICGCPQAQAEAASQQQTPFAGAAPQQPQTPPQQQQYQQQYQQPGPGYQQPGPGYQQQPNYTQAAPAGPSPVGSAFKNLVPFLKSYFRSPVEATRTAIQQNDLILSIILLVIQAIVAGLVIYSFLFKVCRLFFNFALYASGGYSYSTYSRFGGPSISPSFIMCLLYGILAAVIAIALFAVVIFIVAKITKSTCSFKDVLIACGANSLFVTIFLLVSFLLFFLSVRAGLAFFIGALVCWVAMGVPTAKAVTPDSGQGSFWMSFLVGALVTLLLGGWISSKFLGFSIGAVKISDGNQSFTVNELIKQAGGFDNIIDDIMDDMFY